MKLLLFICLLFPCLVSAQNCDLARYRQLLREADEAAFGKKPDYQLAVNKLLSAKTCWPDSEAVVNVRLFRVFEEVNRQRELAVKNEREAKRQQRQSKALYLASEAWNMRKNDPVQALRLLEKAYHLYPSHPSVLEKIVPAFYEGNVEGLYKNNFQNDFFVNEARFSKNDSLVLTWTYHNIRVWNTSGRLVKEIRPNGRLIEGARFISSDSAVVFTSDSTLIITGLKSNWQKEIICGSAIVHLDVSASDDILTTTEDGKVMLTDWRRKKSTEINLAARAKGAVFSPDGSEVIIRCGKTAYICNTGGLILDSLAFSDEISSAVLSHDNSMVAVAAGDSAYVWSRAHKYTTKLPHSNSVRKVFFTRNAQMLVSVYDSSIAHMEMQNAVIWSLAGEALDTLRHSGTINAVEFSPDGKEILTASRDSTVKMWNMQGELLRVIRHNGGVNTVFFSKNGRQILTASDDYTAKLWEKEIYRVPVISNSFMIEKALYACNDTLVVALPTVDARDTIKIWEQDGALKKSVVADALFTDFDVSQKDNLLLAATDNGVVILFDLPAGNKKNETRLYKNISQVAFSPSGNYFLVVADSAVWIFETASYKKIATLIHRADVKKAVFSPDGRKALTISGDNMVNLWNLQSLSGKPNSIFSHPESVNYAAFSPDGSEILTSTLDRKAILWKSTGQRIRSFPHAGGVNAAIFSPDGKQILTIADDYTVRLWDKTDNRAPLNTFSFSGNSYAVSYSHSGELISVCWGQVYKIDLTYQPMGGVALFDKELNLVANYIHDSGVNAAQFSKDGKRILSSSWDGRLRTWLTPEGILDWSADNIAPIHNRLIKKYDVN